VRLFFENEKANMF
jgi:hypothetical protein